MAVEYNREIYFTWRAINGYNKAINFAMSPREPGKTTSYWFEHYNTFKKNHKPVIYLVRQVVEIGDALIDSIIENNIRKFTDDKFQITYNQGKFKDGIVDVYISFCNTDADGVDHYEDKEIFFRIISLSIKLRRIKLALLKGCNEAFMDEYIIDPKTDEKYLNNEASKIKEAYTTWRREATGLFKMYFAGNPYSLYNPLFMWLKVDTTKLRRGSFYVGDIFVIQWATLHPKLREKLLKENPLYQFDEEYSDYALEGNPANDKNINLGAFPSNYHLDIVFRIMNTNIGVFKNNYIDDMKEKYYCKSIDDMEVNRCIYCFDFSEMIERSVLVSSSERTKFQHFKNAIRTRNVCFSDVNIYYLISEIYKFL